MFGISLLVWAVLILDGRIQSPMNDWMMKGISMLLVLTAVGAGYQTWIAGPLFGLPAALSGAVSSTGSPEAVLDTLAGNLIELLKGIAEGMVDAFAGFNFGGAFLLFQCLVAVGIAGLLLLVACAFNYIYALIGLALVLGVGPFFVLCLFWPQIRGYFFSWLNTALYFVFLSVMSTMFVVLFIGIANGYMDKLRTLVESNTAAGASFTSNVYALVKAMFSGAPPATTAGVAAQPFIDIFSIGLQMNFVFLPMFFVALEMRTLVSSMTSGSGGSFGSGAVNVGRQIMRMAGKSV
jgi:type IV secretion system protein VirB6